MLFNKRPFAYPAATTLATFPLCAIKDLSAPSLSNVQSLVRPVLHSKLEGCHKSLEAVLWPVGELDHDTYVVWTIKQLHRLHELLGSREQELLAMQNADISEGSEVAAPYAQNSISDPKGGGGEGGKGAEGGKDASKLERSKMKERKELVEMVWDCYRELDRVAEKKM